MAEVVDSVVKSVELPNDVRLPYVEVGNPAGVPVLLLPGLGDSWRSFEPVLNHLPQSVHAIALTLRGHGDASKPPEGYRFRHFAADLAAFMDALDVEAAVLVGHSASGLFMQRFTADQPERVRGLVFIGSPATLRDHPGLRAAWDSTISKLTDPVDPKFVREIQESALVQPVPEEFFETLVQEALKVPARVWRASFEGLLEDDLSAELDKIKSPTLMIWGDRDALLSRSDQERLAAAIGHSRLIVYGGAGHSPHWEDPERFAADLAAFIDEVS